MTSSWLFLSALKSKSDHYCTYRLHIIIYVLQLMYRRFQWSRSVWRWSAALRLLKSRAPIQPSEWMSVFCECCVSSLWVLCVVFVSVVCRQVEVSPTRPNTRPEKSYWVWCVCVWYCNLNNGQAVAPRGGGGPTFFIASQKMNLGASRRSISFSS